MCVCDIPYDVAHVEFGPDGSLARRDSNALVRFIPSAYDANPAARGDATAYRALYEFLVIWRRAVPQAHE